MNYQNIINRLKINGTKNEKPLSIKGGQNKPNPAMKRLLEDQALLRKKISEEVVFAKPIISLNGLGVIFENTINIIQGKYGTHKSRMTEILCTLLLAVMKINILGFERNAYNSTNYTLLYVDTERNLNDQFPFALQSIIKKSGYSVDQPPANLDWLTLINIPRKERFKTLEQYLIQLRGHCTNHLVIILDVVTDCLSSFNNLEESLALIDLMNVLVNEHNATFICVIHENPGGEKARGHLGSEIANKSTTQIQVSLNNLKEQDDFVKVKFLKTRRSKKPVEFFAKYCDHTKSLVLIDEEDQKQLEQTRKCKATVDEIKEYLPQVLIAKMERQKLIEILMEHFDCSKNTILDRLKIIINDQPLIQLTTGNYCFKQSKVKKTVFYELELVDKEEE